MAKCRKCGSDTEMEICENCIQKRLRIIWILGTIINTMLIAASMVSFIMYRAIEGIVAFIFAMVSLYCTMSYLDKSGFRFDKWH